MGTKLDKVDKAYMFLREKADAALAFTAADLASASGWTTSSVKTNVSKKFKGLVEKTGSSLRVSSNFTSVTLEQFRALLSQKKRAFSSYRRSSYSHVVTFEFLLPLTQQDRLREALDALFYRDTLEARVKEFGLKKLEKLVFRRPSASDAEFTGAVINEIEKLFGGYSIGHVSGRFRAAPLMARSEAWKHRYVVDETTAVVRFIVPCASSMTMFTDGEDVTPIVDEAEKANGKTAIAEAGRIRGLFFAFFVEAIVKRIHNEDEIWLLENGVKSRLYVWARSTPGA